MSAQAAVALQPEESLPAQEAVVSNEVAQESPIEKAIQGENPEKVINIFRGRAQKEKEALGLLGQLNPEELAAAPSEALEVKAANDNASEKISAAESLAIQKVAEVIPMTQVEVPAPVIAEAAPEVATEVVHELNASAELVKDAEDQRDIAAELLKEEFEALSAFTKEHGITIDTSDSNNIKVQDSELSKLTKVERSYVYTLVGKHQAGNASMRHAEKLLEAYSVPESDPRRAALMAEAQSLAEEAKLKEVAAHIIQEQYVKLPEIAALVGAVGGENTGGSMGGSDFSPADSPYGQGPKKTESRASAVLGYGGVGGEGLVKIDAYKPPDAGPAVVKKPSLIDRWFRKNVSDLTGGAVDPTKSSRE